MASERLVIEDVRLAIDGAADEGPLDPFETNASVIHSRLGRGSFGTIQKFLNIIRDELTAQVKSGGDDGDDVKSRHVSFTTPSSDSIASIWEHISEKVHSDLMRRFIDCSDNVSKLEAKISSNECELIGLREKNERLDNIARLLNEESVRNLSKIDKLESLAEVLNKKVIYYEK